MLIGAQQMGWTHALSHVRLAAAGSEATAASRSGTTPQADKLCEQCLSFAQIDAVLADSMVNPAVHIVPAADRPCFLHAGVLPATTCVFRSRAPPFLL